ncbi:MAG: SLAC1 anion channel family protein [Rhizobiaceae bacterium]
MTRTENNWILAGLTPAYFAPVMGVAGLGISWRISSAVLGATPIIGEILVALSFVIFLVMVLLFILKTVRVPASIKSSFGDSSKLVFFPLIPLSGLLLSIGMRPYNVEFSTWLWLFSAPFNLYFAVVLTGRWIFNHQERTNISPAWLFPIVGNAVVPIAGVPLGYADICWLFFSVGGVLWVFVFAALFHRMIFEDFLPPQLMPSLAIVLSPPAILFIALYELKNGEIDTLSYALIYTSLFLFAVFLPHWRRLVLVPISITLWSLTFPLTALTIATLLFYKGQGHLWQWWLSASMLGIASIAVSYVSIVSVIGLVRRRTVLQT